MPAGRCACVPRPYHAQQGPDNNKKREETAINLIIQIGFALCLASTVVFHIRLYQMNSHLREHYPAIWRTFGTGNEHLTRAGQYVSITKLTTEYRVNDAKLDEKFLVLRRIHQSGAIGVVVLIIGIIYEILA